MFSRNGVSHSFQLVITILYIIAIIVTMSFSLYNIFG